MSYQQGHPQQQYAPPPGAPPAPQQHQQQYYPQQHAPPPPPQQQQQQQLQQHLAPQQQHVGQQHPSDNGQFPGGSYSVTHRDTNAVLNITLQQGANVRSKSGAMVHMSGNVQLTGKVKFSMKKLFTGGEMSESTYNGPGRVALAPTLFGDIITLHVDGRTPWVIGKDAFLACTSEVAKETKSQGISKALFSGEDLFVYNVVGQGIMWLTSFGAVDRVDLQAGETHIVDNGHLVAWSCNYKIEKAGGGTMSGLKTGEGLVCRFSGPGSVFVQTRNQGEFETYIRAHSASGGA
jgi:uncharacterized protein (TIGR00266 family)